MKMLIAALALATLIAVPTFTTPVKRRRCPRRARHSGLMVKMEANCDQQPKLPDCILSCEAAGPEPAALVMENDAFAERTHRG